MHCLKKFFLIIILPLLPACSDQLSTQTFQLSGNTMGTSYNITVVEKTIEPMLISAVLEDIENTMSTYRTNSELMRLNAAPLNTWINVSQSLYEVLQLSETIHQLSNGAFDPTLGSLINLWGFGPDKINFGSAPNTNEIRAQLENVGYQHLLLAEDRLAVLKRKMINLDLSAIAKGYAVDKLTSLFEARDITNYLVEIGGEISASGVNPQGDLWRIAIETPETNATIREPIRTIKITDKSVASSGDYRNFYEVDGSFFSHTIDPRNGYPITHNLSSVTVIAETTALADALATAFNVIGLDQALTLANRERIPVYFLSKTDLGYSESYSTAFAPFMAHE